MSVSRLNFTVEQEAPGSQARATRFTTLHNEVLTPLFMPVGTQATVKAQLPQTLESSGSQILLANTYHLLLRPGPEVFERFGGIHNFTTWPKSFLTDSGGYQIFSLPHARSMTEDGASFQSYVDGRTYLLSPELSIGTQRSIGSDIMMALDQCVAATADEPTARAAVELTQRWAVRSLAARGDSPQSIFAIVQGAVYPDLRRASAAGLTELPFDGFAVGGLAVGEGKSEREDTCALSASLLPREKPRYLMGVGTPLDILEAVHRGIDMFDCIIPTQVAKRGGAFTSRGFLQLRRAVHKYSDEPLDPDCTCGACARYSRGYLHHLTKASETLGWTLLGEHNIHFYHQLMREIRASILEGNFIEFYKNRRQLLAEDDLDNPVDPIRPKPTKRPTLGDYEIHTAREGFASILHRASGEIMHARTPPMEEANRLYVDQSNLAARLTEPTDTPLTIWDVGLGAAANAMGAIKVYERQKDPARPLRIISFENDLDSLRLAFAHNDQFPYLRHSAPHHLLRHGHWQSKSHPGLTWTLVHGDYVETLAAAPGPPDIVFYDMFSAKTTNGPWTLAAFRRLRTACADQATELFTYTNATSTRTVMLAAGFHLARGVATPPKDETTIALTPAALGLQSRQLLPATWLEKWSRSDLRFPPELSESDHPAFEHQIRTHPQFARCPSPSR